MTLQHGLTAPSDHVAKLLKNFKTMLKNDLPGSRNK
jgi:hypothetical protein